MRLSVNTIRKKENGGGLSNRERVRQRGGETPGASVVSPLLSANCPRASWPRSKWEIYCRILCAVGKLNEWVGQPE